MIRIRGFPRGTHHSEDSRGPYILDQDPPVVCTTPITDTCTKAPMFGAKLSLSGVKDSDVNLRNLRLHPEAPCFKKEYPRDDAEKAREISALLKSTGFVLTKWSSSSREI